jgi:hypothetical protein
MMRGQGTEEDDAVPEDGDGKPVDGPVPRVLVDGPRAPSVASRWTVRVVVYTSADDDASPEGVGTGVVANNQWILTAAHVVRDRRLSPPTQVQERRELARRLGVFVENPDGTLTGGRFLLDDVAFGHGDIAALHVRRSEFTEELRDRGAPIATNIEPATLIGDIVITIGPRGPNGSLRQSTARVRLVGGDVVRGDPVNGITNHGDSGGPVAINNEPDGLQVVGLHIGARRDRHGEVLRTRWVAFAQEEELFRLVMGEPFQVTLETVPPNNNDSVATCSYQISRNA